MADSGAELVGMGALTRDVRRLTIEGGALERALSQGARRAIEPAASTARGSYPRDSGELAGSVAVSATRTGAKVHAGGAVAYAGPVDFGGWPEGRDYTSSGRYLFPAAGELDGAALDAYGQATQGALESFSWTNTTSNPEAVHD